LSERYLGVPEELTWNEIMALWTAAREHDAYVHRSGNLESERETTQLIESGLGKLRRRFHALNLKDVVVTSPDGSSLG
jgi:hypothetical protein